MLEVNEYSGHLTTTPECICILQYLYLLPTRRIRMTARTNRHRQQSILVFCHERGQVCILRQSRTTLELRVLAADRGRRRLGAMSRLICSCERKRRSTDLQYAAIRSMDKLDR